MNATIQSLFSLNGKTAIVTGGAMGIGSGIAKRLAEAGANILIVDIVEKEEALDTMNEIYKIGGKVEYFQADIAKTSNVDAIIEKAIMVFGDIHILVNNAGIFKYLPVTNLTEELWDRTMNINLKAAAFLSKAVVNFMIVKKHGGRIINISSIDSLKPSGNLATYDASKGGIRMLTRSFAKEVGKYGITVNDIAPGGVNTPGAAKILGDQASKEQMEAMKAGMEQFVKSLPLQRMGEPEDIANATLFLASNASAYITGTTIVVDGGLLLI
jgi:2-deoxy-D-gluconate 3-dehydrogenase